MARRTMCMRVRVFSPGDEVEAFQDTDGDWRVKGAFTGSWAVRTVGLTGLGAVVMLVLAGANLRPGRGVPNRGQSAAPRSE